MFLYSQIYDASTNTWKIVNERSHTDFVEKIVETPHETIIIDDVTDITKIKSINDRTERFTDITDITDVNSVTNTYNLHDTEEKILREVVTENVLVSGRCLVHIYLGFGCFMRCLMIGNGHSFV